MTIVDSSDAALIARDDDALAAARIADTAALLAKDPQALRDFFDALTVNASPDDVTRLTPQGLAAFTRQIFQRLQNRRPGQTLVEIFEPQEEATDYPRHETVFLALNDDSPFLFNSTLGEVNQAGARIRAVFHPIFKSTRDGQDIRESVIVLVLDPMRAPKPRR